MKAFVAVLAFAAGIGTVRAGEPAKRNVVLIGTIISIDEIREEFSVDYLGITVSVDKVISGSIKEATIRFVLPAVAQDRMQVGSTHEIHARRTPDGYKVGETDIRTIKTAPGTKPTKDLLLVVTVTAMKDTADDMKRPWVVSTKVEKILSGELPGQTFRFAINSPRQAGLKVGKRYTIPARWTGKDYEVDELDVGRHNH